jgi:hypothetical protein
VGIIVRESMLVTPKRQTSAIKQQAPVAAAATPLAGAVLPARKGSLRLQPLARPPTGGSDAARPPSSEASPQAAAVQGQAQSPAQAQIQAAAAPALIIPGSQSEPELKLGLDRFSHAYHQLTALPETPAIGAVSGSPFADSPRDSAAAAASASASAPPMSVVVEAGAGGASSSATPRGGKTVSFAGAAPLSPLPSPMPAASAHAAAAAAASAAAGASAGSAPAAAGASSAATTPAKNFSAASLAAHDALAASSAAAAASAASAAAPPPAEAAVYFIALHDYAGGHRPGDIPLVGQSACCLCALLAHLRSRQSSCWC